MKENIVLDTIDRRILALLQEDTTLAIAEIGEKVGLSATPCWKRIKRLEREGIIKRRVAILDRDKLGLGVTVIVAVRTASHSEDWLENFSAGVSRIPEVVEFYRMSGEIDYLLKIVVRDAGDQVDDEPAAVRLAKLRTNAGLLDTALVTRTNGCRSADRTPPALARSGPCCCAHPRSPAREYRASSARKS